MTQPDLDSDLGPDSEPETGTAERKTAPMKPAQTSSTPSTTTTPNTAKVYSLGIVGVITRKARVDALAKKTNPDLVSIDDFTLGINGHHLKVWTELAERKPKTDWTLVIEDDALLPDDFTEQLAEAFANVPPGQDVVSFYLGTGHPRGWQASFESVILRAIEADASWITGRSEVHHAVALAIRTPLVQSMVDYVGPRSERGGIDSLIGSWAKTFQHPVAYSAYQLVDHDDDRAQSTQRIVSKKIRRAHNYGTPPNGWTPVSVDWQAS